MRVLCVVRCFDSGKCHGYLEDETYDLSAEEIRRLKKIGLARYFKELPEDEPEPEPEAKRPGKKSKAEGENPEPDAEPEE